MYSNLVMSSLVFMSVNVSASAGKIRTGASPANRDLESSAYNLGQAVGIIGVVVFAILCLLGGLCFSFQACLCGVGVAPEQDKNEAVDTNGNTNDKLNEAANEEGGKDREIKV